jgi:hypothetical protein
MQALSEKHVLKHVTIATHPKSFVHAAHSLRHCSPRHLWQSELAAPNPHDPEPAVPSPPEPPESALPPTPALPVEPALPDLPELAPAPAPPPWSPPSPTSCVATTSYLAQQHAITPTATTITAADFVRMQSP